MGVSTRSIRKCLVRDAPLSLHLLPLLPTTFPLSPPYRPGECVILPALTHLNLQGITWGLEDFVGKIDAPGLRDIEITFLAGFIDEPIFDVPMLRRFIDWLKIQISYPLSVVFPLP